MEVCARFQPSLRDEVCCREVSCHSERSEESLVCRVLPADRLGVLALNNRRIVRIPLFAGFNPGRQGVLRLRRSFTS